MACVVHDTEATGVFIRLGFGLGGQQIDSIGVDLKPGVYCTQIKRYAGPIVEVSRGAIGAAHDTPGAGLGVIVERDYISGSTHRRNRKDQRHRNQCHPHSCKRAHYFLPFEVEDQGGARTSSAISQQSASC